MTITVGADQVDNGKVQLFISRDLATGWRIESLSPTPSTESSSDDWLIYELDVLGETPPEVKVLYRGEGFGRHGGAMRVGDGDPLEIWQWIYP